MNLPQENPRRSKVKDALAAEAVRFSNFDDFAKAYWLDCSRGIYWYATNNEQFDITKREIELAKAGKFQVACNPEFAFKGAANENKKFVAELNVNNLEKDDFQVVRGSDGAKIRIIDNLDLVKVTRIMDRDKAFRSWKYQQSLLPSSKDQLKEIWKKAHKAEKKRQAEEKKKAERLRKKQEKRAKKEAKRRAASSQNPLPEGMQLPPQYGGPTEVTTDLGKYSYAGREEDYDVYQIEKIHIGIVDGSIYDPQYDWEGRDDRFYAYNIEKKREAEGASLEEVLDKAYRGKTNPKKNPSPYLINALMNPPENEDEGIVYNLREIPKHINSPKY